MFISLSDNYLATVDRTLNILYYAPRLFVQRSDSQARVRYTEKNLSRHNDKVRLPRGSKRWTNVTYIMYTENGIRSLTANTQCTHQQGFKPNYMQDAHTHTHTHTHAHTHTYTHTRTHAHARTGQTHARTQTTHTHTHIHRGECPCCLDEMFGEEKRFELAFEGRESSRVPDVLREIVPEVGTEVWENAKARGGTVMPVWKGHKLGQVAAEILPWWWSVA